MTVKESVIIQRGDDTDQNVGGSFDLRPFPHFIIMKQEEVPGEIATVIPEAMVFYDGLKVYDLFGRNLPRGGVLVIFPTYWMARRFVSAAGLCGRHKPDRWHPEGSEFIREERHKPVLAVKGILSAAIAVETRARWNAGHPWASAPGEISDASIERAGEADQEVARIRKVWGY